jgi:hypothetical protein
LIFVVRLLEPCHALLGEPAFVSPAIRRSKCRAGARGRLARRPGTRLRKSGSARASRHERRILTRRFCKPRHRPSAGLRPASGSVASAVKQPARWPGRRLSRRDRCECNRRVRPPARRRGTRRRRPRMCLRRSSRPRHMSRSGRCSGSAAGVRRALRSGFLRWSSTSGKGQLLNPALAAETFRADSLRG